MANELKCARVVQGLDFKVELGPSRDTSTPAASTILLLFSPTCGNSSNAVANARELRCPGPNADADNQDEKYDGALHVTSDH
jgi:hypothetical protein